MTTKSFNQRKLIAAGITSAGFVALAAAILIQTPALAMVNAQVGVGKRYATSSFEGTSKKYGADEYAASASIDPIPLVPVAAGATMTIQNWNKDDFGATKTTGSELTLDVKAWVPMVPIITPYAKFSYVVTGKMLVEANADWSGDGTITAGKQTMSLTGTHLTLGAQYGILPLVSAVLEVGMGTEKIKTDEVTVSGVKIASAGDSTSWNSNSVSLGINVGF